ncbi:peptidoglycan hydrolase-like protein with peptidoglycan-binding domain [Neobacillus bataviensis]|uniref:Autolysin n=1 Tax=Neobacillus bataviensis TaxID=220685 RepID=A0A561D7G5_9BACI|nr:N-acetylmuramoyl-L-alanine amidase [Neobacillus bataviensis]TWD99393.1 peptidoglycan hydrolase-like protein with peptidoglycan-binding domain [Neobacillus bataviensis]
MAFEILTVDQVIQRLKGRKYKYTQVHHTWEPSHNDFNGKNHLQLQQSMRNYHVNTRGWDDIGQHVTLMPDGLFVTGRPFNETPAGIAGYNEGAFMTEMLGNFDIGHDVLEGAQLNSMLKLQHYLVTACGAKIMFHREHASKTCPGTSIDRDEFVSRAINYDTLHPTLVAAAHTEVPSTISTSKPSSSTKSSPNLLKSGDKGPDVKKLQQYLIKAGEKLPKYGTDSDFGKETEAAVRSFQAKHGLAVDGIVGPKTRAKLETAATASANRPYPGHLIKRGSNDAVNIKLIQKRVGVAPDGIFGPKTEAAVKAYQKSHGLASDGIVGPRTWSVMF